MNFIVLLSCTVFLLFSCRETESDKVRPETHETPNGAIIKLDSSNRQTLINELTRISNEQPDGISLSGLLMKQEKGPDNISRLTILSDSGSMVTIPYNPPLSTEEVRKFTRDGSEVSIKYTISDKGDTTVVSFAWNNK